MSFIQLSSALCGKISEDIERICDHLRRQLRSFNQIHDTVQTLRATGESGDAIIAKAFIENGVSPDLVQSLRNYNVRQLIDVCNDMAENEESMFFFYFENATIAIRAFHAMEGV